MDNGWQDSAQAWIREMGEGGDFARRYVLDPVMRSRALKSSPKRALDVGCAEGRFCRMLKSHDLKVTGLQVTGVDPTPALIAQARARDAQGTYLEASAERLPFGDETFDLVISYLSLIDIPDFRNALQEMALLLKPGGNLLIANLTNFNTACRDAGWVKDIRLTST